ncbi:MAG: hypothetical protein EPN21_11440 [Methylococcaceae bacterium]|nr:MAG: hypothetical protein EPN21_11440 [Methylococcaceae bacterium]
MHPGFMIVLLGLILLAPVTTTVAGQYCPATPAYPATPASMLSQRNDIPARLEWNANFGYCGEAAFVSAGLYYGQYISQYDARALASPRVPQQLIRSQLLVGGNDRDAARRMHLAVEPLYTQPGSDPAVFLSWVKENVVNGHPVAIGVYENKSVLPLPSPDPQYDHIVPVIGIDTPHDLHDPAYHGDDRMVFSDNGLYTPDQPEVYPFYYSYAFDDFLKSRRQANRGTSPYALAKNTGNYGIAFTGVMDQRHETVPVRVTTDVNCERPAIKNHSSRRPAPMPLELTVTVSGMAPGVGYVLYEYDKMEAVPDENFNDPVHADAALYRCAIPADAGAAEFVTRQAIDSSQMTIFRAVQAPGYAISIPDCPAELPARR